MKVVLKEEYKGQLSLRWVPLKREYEYILTHYTYPRDYADIAIIEEGDEIVIRQPGDGSIVMKRKIELERENFRQMDPSTGTFHQIVNGQPVSGLQKGLDPSYWLSLFNNGYHADLIKKV